MTKLFARFLVGLVTVATTFLGRWRRLTVRARVHDALTPESVVTVNGTTLTLLVPDRRSVYWPRHGYASEPNTLTWIDGFIDTDVLYDVGANVGAYALYAAKARGVRVVAFEPNPFSFRALVHNLQRNRLTDKVTPLCLAANDTTGATPFYLSGTDTGSVGHTLSGTARDRKGFEMQALAFRLDEVAAFAGVPKPTQMKIDVDGIELPILKGAKSLLSDPRLKSVMIEVLTHDEPDRRRIADLLRDCGLTPAADWRDDGSDNRLFVRNA